MKLDFIAVGDITTDAFIELDKKSARIDSDPDTGRKRLSMSFGDKLPYKNTVVVPAVGNAPNASVSAARLGLKSGLITNLGTDRGGKECLSVLRREGVRTTYATQHEGKETNYHYVLRYGAERTILIKHEHYDYVWPDLPEAPRYIYFSSVGEDGLEYHHTIAQYVKEHPETKLVFQPGTYQLRLGYKKLKDLYAVTHLFFCNKEEAQGLLDTKEDDMRKLLDMMHELGPEIVVITDGTNGAYAKENGVYWYMKAYPDPAPPNDRTGAGDSFSSTFTTALALGKPIRTALAWGGINSMSVVQYIGAQEGLLTQEKIEEYLEKAPRWYRAKPLE